MRINFTDNREKNASAQRYVAIDAPSDIEQPEPIDVPSDAEDEISEFSDRADEVES